MNSAGKIEYHSPISYPSFPSADRSALVTITQEAWAKIEALARSSDPRQVTLGLIEQWKREAEAAGSKFVVLALYLPSDRYFYLSEFEKRGITFIDGTANDLPAPESLVAGDGGHPVPRIHTDWAEVAANFFADGGPPADRLSDYGLKDGKLTKAGAPLAPRDNIAGFTETAARDRDTVNIEGWVWDQSSSDAPISIVATHGDTILEIVKARFKRPDVAEIMHAPPMTGFRLKIPWNETYRSARPHFYAVSKNSVKELPCVGTCESAWDR